MHTCTCGISVLPKRNFSRDQVLRSSDSWIGDPTTTDHRLDSLRSGERLVVEGVDILPNNILNMSCESDGLYVTCKLCMVETEGSRGRAGVTRCVGDVTLLFLSSHVLGLYGHRYGRGRGGVLLYR